MDSEKQSEGFGGVEGERLGEPGGRYYGGHVLHGALSVVHKTMNLGYLKKYIYIGEGWGEKP